jgi:hypothetical protein
MGNPTPHMYWAMTTLTAYFEADAQPEAVKPQQQSCDICGLPGACRDIQGTPVCEECYGPAPEPITGADVKRVITALDKLSISALAVMGAICLFWLM